MRTAQFVASCLRYSKALAYALSSLAHHPSRRVHAIYTCFCTGSDQPTIEMLAWFAKLFHDRDMDVRVDIQLQEPHEVCFRGYGRNMAALSSQADVVIFADCDYYYGAGCLDSLATLPIDPDEPGYSLLYYPEQVLFTVTKERGDWYTSRVDFPRIYAFKEWDEQYFTPQRWRRAVGGFQCVPGDVARKYGYCAKTKWAERPPRPQGKPRFCFRSDTVYRKLLGTAGKPWPIPAVYRIRESQSGVCDELTPAQSPCE